MLRKLETYLTPLCQKILKKYGNIRRFLIQTQPCSVTIFKSLFSLTRFVDWLSLWAQLFFTLPFKISANDRSVCAVTACLQIFTKH